MALELQYGLSGGITFKGKISLARDVGYLCALQFVRSLSRQGLVDVVGLKSRVFRRVGSTISLQTHWCSADSNLAWFGSRQ